MSLISKENIQKYVPQYPPFLMVDTLESYEEKKAVSSFTILDTNVLLDKNIFSDSGILENIAQTCALHAGYQFMNAMNESTDSASDKKAPVGFIGSIKDYIATQSVQVGDTIFTHVIIEHNIGPASVVRGNVYLNDALIASCEMKIFLAA
jgi:3-hydroxyacyl-[acyl-carrier-protein] dehydratase